MQLSPRVITHCACNLFTSQKNVYLSKDKQIPSGIREKQNSITTEKGNEQQYL